MMEFTNLFVLTAVLLAAVMTDSDALEIECQDVSLERGSSATVSCNFDLNFIAVFWYKGEANNPFLRLEERRPTVEEGFQITPNGAMIIENVQVKHEGIYKISVLDADGASNSESMLISVKVTLLEEPVLQMCTPNGSPKCTGAGDGESSLICETKETRPAVDFVWTKLSSNESVKTESSFYNSVMNETTGLYYSYSTIHINPKEFSLQLFTCEAIGDAVNTSKSSSLFLNGIKDVTTREDSPKMVTQGSSLRIRCPKEDFLLGVLNVTYMNDTAKTLITVYPGDDDVFCELGSRCIFNENEEVIINEISFKDEGTYNCTSSDGTNVIKYSTVVHTMIAPSSEGVIVDECEDSSRCEKNVDLKGTLLSSILGARPQVKIMCEAGKETDSMAFIFNERTAIEENKDAGTFDTHYTIEYKIPECSKPVHVQCYVSPDSVHNNVNAANVNLITDTSACENGKSGLTAALVIVIIVIILAVVVTTLVIYKKKDFGHFVSRRQNNDVEISITKLKSMQSKENDEMQGKPLLGETYESSKHALEEIQNLPDCKQKAFKEKFDPFIAKVVKKEGTADEFNSLMETFCTENEVKQPASVILNFLMKADDKDLTAIMEFLDEIKPNQWVSFLDIMRMLDELSAAKKLPGDRTLQFFEEYTKSNQINYTTFVNLTGNLLTSQCITLQSLQRAFRSIVESKEQHHLVLAESFLQYHLLGYISEEDAVKEMISFVHSNTIPLHYFFQTTYLQYGEKVHVKNKPKLFVIFKRLLERMQSNAGESKEKLYPQSNGQNFIKQSTVYGPVDQFMKDNNDYTEQDLSSIFIEVFICSIETKDDYVIFKLMLESAQRNGRLSPRNYVDAIVNCIRKKWITQDFQENMLWYMLSEKLVTDEEDKNCCFQALLEENGPMSFLIYLHSCNKANLVDDTYFVRLVCQSIKDCKIREEDYKVALKKLGESGNVTKEELENLKKEILEAAKNDPEMETSRKRFRKWRASPFPKEAKKSTKYFGNTVEINNEDA